MLRSSGILFQYIYYCLVTIFFSFFCPVAHSLFKLDLEAFFATGKFCFALFLFLYNSLS